MGVEPYLLASSLLGVLAQRLVRCLCPNCRRTEAPTTGEAAVLERLGVAPARSLYRPIACDACGHTGYRGRTGIYELIVLDQSLSRLIHDQSGEPALREACARAGVRSLAADGGRWLADGTTSLAELLRVTGEAA
jgi:general secretion pathway protein E